MVGAILHLALGAVTLWGESSMSTVDPAAAPPSSRSASVHLYAARGEAESFQLCVRPGAGGSAGIEVTGESPGPGIGPPRIHRVGFVAAGDDRRPIADPLLPPGAAPVSPDETAVYWVTYTVHRDCPPGTYTGRLSVQAAAGPKQTFPVSIEVFDFALPEIPSFPALFRLDMDRLTGLYGLGPDAVLSWKPFYDVLGDFRIAFGLSGDGFFSDGAATDRLKTHLAYAVPRARMPVVDVTPGPDGAARFAQPEAPNAQDALQTYLIDMSAWLAKEGWSNRALFRPAAIVPDADWAALRAAYFRVRRADRSVALMMEGPIHPYFERYVDIWAPPLDRYQPNAHRALEAGRSLGVRQGAEAAAVTASSAAAPPDGVTTRAEDAYDGSAFSEWWSGAGAHRETLRIELVEPVTTRTVRIGWVPGREAPEITVRTSFDGRVYSRAKVSWRHSGAVHTYDRSLSEGAFVTDKRILGIEFAFDRPRDGGPIAVAEVELTAPLGESVDRPNPAQVWFRAPATGFPDLRAGGPPAAPRLCGWVMWAHRADGLLGGDLNPWPDDWGLQGLPESVDDYAGWTYPGPGGLLPSIRLHRLRDGLEDAEYAKLAAEAAAGEGARLPPDAEAAIALRYFTARPDAEAVARYESSLEAWRMSLGRFIANPHAPVTNFQGGRR